MQKRLNSSSAGYKTSDKACILHAFNLMVIFHVPCRSVIWIHFIFIANSAKNIFGMWNPFHSKKLNQMDFVCFIFNNFFLKDFGHWNSWKKCRTLLKYSSFAALINKSSFSFDEMNNTYWKSAYWRNKIDFLLLLETRPRTQWIPRKKQRVRNIFNSKNLIKSSQMD